MRVLLCHDYYRSSAPSGEDSVFRSERRLLESNGVEVISYERFNDNIREETLAEKVALARDTIWSRASYRELSALIRTKRPKVAHFHNTFPLISPSAYAACRDNGVPVVQTLHNYRFVCAGALLLREGKPCEDCLGTTLLPALRHRCYRGSFAATSVLVSMLMFNRWRKSYTNLVNRYIALTPSAVPRLARGGLPETKIAVKPNFLSDPPSVGRGNGGFVLYVGRLTAEKGVRTLIDAWRRMNGIPLKIVGDGALRIELEEKAKQGGLSVEFLGFIPHSMVLDMVRDAAALIVPSACYEGFPTAVIEAYACGTPVIASRLGSLDEVVLDGETGLKFATGNAHDLARTVRALLGDTERIARMRKAARALFEQQYTAEKNYAALIRIYEAAIHDLEQCKTRPS